MAEDKDDVEFIDAENYVSTPNAPITYEMLVLEHIRRCISEGSKEMTGGYVKHKNTSRGPVEEYIPDQRAIYIQCVKTLYDMLLPFFDKVMWEKKRVFRRRLTTLKDNIFGRLQERANLSKGVFRTQLAMQVETGYLDANSLEYKRFADGKIEVYRWLYQQLILLFNRKKFLMGQAIED